MAHRARCPFGSTGVPSCISLFPGAWESREWRLHIPDSREWKNRSGNAFPMHVVTGRYRSTVQRQQLTSAVRAMFISHSASGKWVNGQRSPPTSTKSESSDGNKSKKQQKISKQNIPSHCPRQGAQANVRLGRTDDWKSTQKCENMHIPVARLAAITAP